MYIKNRRDSDKFKGCSPLQPLCDLIEKCNEVANFSYTSRCVQFKQPLESNLHLIRNI